MTGIDVCGLSDSENNMCVVRAETMRITLIFCLIILCFCSKTKADSSTVSLKDSVLTPDDVGLLYGTLIGDIEKAYPDSFNDTMNEFEKREMLSRLSVPAKQAKQAFIIRSDVFARLSSLYMLSEYDFKNKCFYVSFGDDNRIGILGVKSRNESYVDFSFNISCLPISVEIDTIFKKIITIHRFSISVPDYEMAKKIAELRSKNELLILLHFSLTNKVNKGGLLFPKRPLIIPKEIFLVDDSLLIYSRQAVECK